MRRSPGAQPAGSAEPGRRIRAGANPTPLDAIFIVFAAVTLLLFLLWVLPGGEAKYSNAPQFLTDMAKSVWAKLSLAGGSAGALILRRYLDKSPSPNYLIWIPSFMGILIVALFLLSKVILPGPINQVPMDLTMSLDKQFPDPDNLRKKYNLADFTLWQDSPDPGRPPHGVIYESGVQSNYHYRDTLIVKQDQKSRAHIKLNPALSNTQDSALPWDYDICLNSSSKRPSQNSSPRIVLNCANGVCTPAKPQDPGYVVACDAGGASTGISLPLVIAGEQTDPQRKPGWDVPFLQTLQKMTDRERVGYTLFDVSFKPQGIAERADKYYYALRVNDQPVYIGGLSPGVEKNALLQGTENHIRFGLENLNFTGQFDGFEKLNLRVFFLAGNTVIYYQDLERDYIALRSAPAIPPLDTMVGTFQWIGEYKKPQNEDRYEVFVASSVCGISTEKDCAARAAYTRDQFDGFNLKFKDRPAVMVVRPPLRKHRAYGLALGLVQPTGQVQFTFNETNANQLCRWAADQIGQGKARGLIRSDFHLDDIEKANGYERCH
jgi:hypothetical protein